jgi:hypothetical protein
VREKIKTTQNFSHKLCNSERQQQRRGSDAIGKNWRVGIDDLFEVVKGAFS